MRLTLGFRKDAYSFIAIASPLVQNLLSQINQLGEILRGKPQSTHRPLYPASLNIWEACKAVFLFYWSLGHSKGIMSTLIMVMGQN